MEITLIINKFLSLFLSFSYVGLLLFFITGWIRLKTTQVKKVEKPLFVSILVPVRNEANTILDLIHDVLNQDYPADFFELIIIDDHSTDQTAELVKNVKDSRLRLIQLNEKKALNSYKKKAITEAIHSSKGELIITTDGDCRVESGWLNSMVGFYQSGGYKFVSGPVTFHQEKNWFEKAQTLEFSFLQGVGGASIRNNFPNTCNGANIAYSKEVFFELNGFEGIDDIASGDDELFLHKVALKYPDKIGFNKSAQAIVSTYAKRSLSEFAKQRKRWASKSLKYRDVRITAIVLMVFFLNVSITLNLLFSLFSTEMTKTLLIQLGSKFMVDTTFVFMLLNFFKKPKQIIYMPLVFIFYTVYILTIGFSGATGKSYEWKGREVR